MYEKIESFVDHNRLLKLGAGATFALALIVLAALCSSAVAQEETADYWLNLGHELYENGSYEEAANAYDKALQIDLENASAWLGKGESLKILYKKGVNLTVLYEVLGFDLQYADAWAARGCVVSTTRRVEEAAKAYEMAVQLYDEHLQENPGDVEAWLNKGRALDMLASIAYILNDTQNSTKASHDAHQAYDKAIGMDPNNSKAWVAKASGLKDNESLGAYNRAIELDPENVEAWLGRANVLSSLADMTDDKSLYEEAIQAYDNALEVDPQDPRTWSSKGYILISLGDYEEATKAYETVIELTPQDKIRWFAKEILYAYNEALRTESEDRGQNRVELIKEVM